MKALFISLIMVILFFSIQANGIDIEKLILEMTLQEKLSMIHGNSYFTTQAVERLGIPGLTLSDGPCGIRYENLPDKWGSLGWDNDSVTYFPSLTALASTWDPQLAAEFGNAYAEEALIRGKNIVLMPGINIHRTPLCGRNWEYFSEDPYINSKFVAPVVNAVQSHNVAVCIKHYILNNQEKERGSVSVELSERALREIYLPGYKTAVDAGALSFMGAYNKFRGQHLAYNDYLVNQVLKEELGFSGVYMSDWNATHDTKEAALYGLDLEMGTQSFNEFYMADALLEKIKSGEIEEKYIDEKVRRILYLMKEIDLFDAPEYDTTGMGSKLGAPHRYKITQKIAEQAVVLLKNTTSLLPLDQSKIKKIAVIGDNATRKHAQGGGSTTVKAKKEVTPLEGIKNLIGSKIEISYSPGYLYQVSENEWDYNKSLDSVDQKLKNEALQLAESSDLVIYIGGLNHDRGLDCEGADKEDLVLPYHQDQLIKELLEVNPNCVLVMISGSPFEMHQWIDQATTLLWSSYIGSEGGTAIANILFGKTNPSGKLATTFPKKLSDSPEMALGEYPGTNGTVHYNEGIFVGYRYYDTYNVEPQFPFGFGLSYTEFEYSNLSVDQKEDEKIQIRFELENSGAVKGREIAQLYISNLNSGIKFPRKELKEFSKIELLPQEKKNIVFEIAKEDLEYYDEEAKEWKFIPGKYEILVGSSSRDIHLKKELAFD